MQQVKKRTEIIKSVKDHKSTTGNRITDIEFICLQIRKILELISLGSLVLNKNQFQCEADKYTRYYHAERILRDIKAINPKYYPQPVIEQFIEYKGHCVRKIENVQEGYLTEEQFAKVYEKCGKIAHAENPFGSKIDIKYYESNIPLWLEKIIRLLNTHIISLVGDSNLYIIHMKEERDDNVYGYIFTNIDSIN